MVLRMARPTKRRGSERWRFRRRVPSDLVQRLVGEKLLIPVGDFAMSATIGSDIRFSLGTADPSIAKLRSAEVDKLAAQLNSATAALKV